MRLPLNSQRDRSPAKAQRASSIGPTPECLASTNGNSTHRPTMSHGQSACTTPRLRRSLELSRRDCIGEFPALIPALMRSRFFPTACSFRDHRPADSEIMSRIDNRTFAARALAKQVRTLLGDRCSNCSCRSDLQVHAPVGDNGDHHKFGSIKRWKFYLEQANLGKAYLLCRTCHQRVTTIEIRQRRRERALRSASLQTSETSSV